MMRRTPLPSNRRGDLTYMLSRTIDIIFSILVIFLVLAIVWSVWKALYGVDKQVQNQYRLVGDLLQGVIEGSTTSAAEPRELTLLADIGKNRKDFKGTIFAISNGKYTSPIPPVFTRSDLSPSPNGVTGDNIMAYIEANKISNSKTSKCDNAACICLSRVPLTKAEELASALGGITECRVFAPPKGKNAVFIDFEKFRPNNVESDVYPIIQLFKDNDCEPVPRGAPAGFDAKQSVCVYGQLKWP